MSASISLAGDRELVQAIERLARGKQNAAFRKAFRVAAKNIRDRAAGKAPRRTGKLARSLKVRAGKRNRQGPSITVISQGETYCGAVEYGTRRQAAQPFIRPAFDELLGQTEATIRRELIAELDRIWASP